MSSKVVRTDIKTWLGANSAETNIIDLTAQYREMFAMLTAEGVSRNDPWIGVQFIGSSEEPTTLYANNTNGCYREVGAVFIHIVERASTSVRDNILDRVEALRNLLRGQRINDIVIEGVTPPNFESGATLQLEAGYQSASIIINYYRDNNIT